MPERILAIDPGERVGWCHAVAWQAGDQWNAGPVELAPQEEAGLSVTGHGITPLRDFAVKLAEVLPNYDTVIYEVYRIQPGKERGHVGSEVPSLQFIGMVRLLGWLNSGVSVVRQTTTDRDTGFKFAKAHLPQVQEILDRMPSTHDDAHDGDALAHLANYYFEKYV